MLAWRNASRSVHERSYPSSVRLWVTAGCVGPGAVVRYVEIFERFPKNCSCRIKRYDSCDRPSMVAQCDAALVEECAAALESKGFASLPVPSATQALFERCFATGRLALDQLPGTDVGELPGGTESASTSGAHHAGALSSYNRCREGFIFSNGAIFEFGGVQGFAASMAALADGAVEVALSVLAGLARRLELPDAGWFERELGPLRSHSQWHLKRYVPEAAPPDAVTSDGKHVLLPVHTDPSLISLVIHDRPGAAAGALGLECLAPKTAAGAGGWEEVSAHGHAVVTVLAGSVLDRITGGRCRAVKHRVALRDPISALAGAPRVVATFFFRPSPDALLCAPPSPLLAGVSARPITFGAWSRKVALRYAAHTSQRSSQVGPTAHAEASSQPSRASSSGLSPPPASDSATAAYATAAHVQHALQSDCPDGGVLRCRPVGSARDRWNS